MELHDYCKRLGREMTAHELSALTESIRENGLRHPIVVYQGKILDGRNRHAACLMAGIAPEFEQFDGDDDGAVEFVKIENSDRRHDTPSQLAIYAAEYAAIKGEIRRGGDRGNQHTGGKPSREGLPNLKAAAREFNVSQASVERAREVITKGTPELVEAVKRGDVPVNQAAKIAREAHTPAPKTTRTKEPSLSYSVTEWQKLVHEERLNWRSELSQPGGASVFNQQDNDSIEWAQWSWNPVTGCLHDCPYCYARDIAERFYPQKFAPTIHPGRFGAPYNTKVPARAVTDVAYRNVFTCSMADLFGRWVPSDWIQSVLNIVEDNPQWNFLFLTKFPKRYAEFTFPDNAWLGTTVDCQARVKAAEEAFANVKASVKWLSLEPMLEPLTFSRLDLFQWLVIGGASSSTRTPEWRVPASWWAPLQTLADELGIDVYHKSNLYVRDKRFPGQSGVVRAAPESFQYLGKKDRRDIVLGETGGECRVRGAERSGTEGSGYVANTSDQA